MGTFSLDEMKRMARDLFAKGVSAVDPSKRLEEMIWIEKDCLFVKTKRDEENVSNLNTFNKIFLIGTGKASASMAKAIEEIFGDRITKGMITTKWC